MGMGDVKLAGVMGLYLGGAVVPALLIAFLFGSLAGAILAVRQGVALRRKTLAFGPFLALGGAVGLVAGPELVRLYGAL
jgi:leader peptidase (prepilin peptidase) / N-methyltransferase